MSSCLPPPLPLFWLLPLLASGLDRLVGDPFGWPHPVQAMGALIAALRTAAEARAGDRHRRLRLAGFALTLTVVGASALAGAVVERLALRWPLAGGAVLVVGLASALAGRSLVRAVRGVVDALPDPALARERLAWIVGRDVEGLPEQEILRAAAETAAENAVDGLFAPLFWMLVGGMLWSLDPSLPGPLALAWAFKAASTLDSMLGYRTGRLRWLGTAGARLDDALTWFPCRLVAFSLPLAAGRPGQLLRWFGAALREGRPDPSPNAGVSQAAYAHAAAVRLGGVNRYGGVERVKPLLAAGCGPPDPLAVERILTLTLRLEALWLLAAMGLGALLAGT